MNAARGAVLLSALLTGVALGVPAGAPVNEYAIHKDGGLVYDPLRREADATGQLARYTDVPANRRELTLGRFKLRVDVPKRATSYDVLPIRYRLSWDRGQAGSPLAFPVAVEAVAFEDESRRRERNLFDLALPGRLDLDVEYLGSITAHLKPGAKHNLKPDLSDSPGVYPPFERRPLVRSGVVEAGDLVWFKFRYTNTGETILDPEGMGGCQWFPELCRRNAAGEFEVVNWPYNQYVRDLEYLYPGESHEVWIHFGRTGDNRTPQNFGLTLGEYLLRLRMTYRRYKEFDTYLNIWHGPPMFVWEMPLVVEPKARQTPVANGKTTLTDGGDPDKITRFLHTFEEFMTAFDCHLAKPAGAAELGIDGTLHLRVAPWTKHVVVKLIATSPVSIATVAVPIDVDSDSLRVEFNPDQKVCIVKDGLLEPVIYSQSMADMRANVQLGPFPERHIRERLREMMDCGINVVSVTSMPWLYDDFNEPKSNYQGDACKYFLDLARQEGMRVEGWGTYPFDRATVEGIANRMTGRGVKMAVYTTSGYPAVSHADPNLPWANAVVWLYQFHRWGDLYYQTPAGDVPIGVEDTRGWMRQDVNVRFPIGDLSLKAFRDWVRAKYATIETVNAAWGTRYNSFEGINPEANQVKNRFGHRWEYTDPKNPFHDWNAAVADFDEFRTELRIRNYRNTLAIVRKEIPGATLCLRTEGANVIVAGIDPADRNPHRRHIYYSQRRCAIIADAIQASGLVRFHSDYTTLPYTPTELRELVRAGVRQGIVPVYLPQFDNMRDMAINEKYGSDYQVHYNLPSPRKGAMMHVLTAVYPWFQATYEEGGVPGILWEDYECDGFATETQKREMRFFLSKLRAALDAPEAKRQRAVTGDGPSQEWRKGSKAMRSYRIAE